MRREAAAARARETERQQERYLKGLGRFSPKKMRLGACEKMRLTEGGGFLGAFGRAAAKAGRARTAAAAADRFAAGSDGGGGGGGGARFPAARTAPAMLHRRYSATENAARRLRRDVHTQGLELGEVVAERRELQARLPTMAVLAMAVLAMATCYGYLLCLLTCYGAGYRRASPSRSAVRARVAARRRPRRCVLRSSPSRQSRHGVVDSGVLGGR